MADRDAGLAPVRLGPVAAARGMPKRHLSGTALVEAVLQRTGHAFADVALVEAALTHASARRGSGTDYQRLEFLGDRVLGLIVAEMLYAAFPAATEGELSLRLNALVNAEALARVADEIELGELILAGAEVRQLSPRKRVNVRADIVEALIAALYLDGGFDAARSFVRRCLEPAAMSSEMARRDAKTELQEWAHQVGGGQPTYEVAGREGPDHDPLFTVSVTIAGQAPAQATGRSKREAEQNAASALLVREGVWKGDTA